MFQGFPHEPAWRSEPRLCVVNDRKCLNSCDWLRHVEALNSPYQAPVSNMRTTRAFEQSHVIWHSRTGCFEKVLYSKIQQGTKLEKLYKFRQTSQSVFAYGLGCRFMSFLCSPVPTCPSCPACPTFPLVLAHSVEMPWLGTKTSLQRGWQASWLWLWHTLTWQSNEPAEFIIQ